MDEHLTLEQLWRKLWALVGREEHTVSEYNYARAMFFAGASSIMGQLTDPMKQHLVLESMVEWRLEYQQHVIEITTGIDKEIPT